MEVPFVEVVLMVSVNVSCWIEGRPSQDTFMVNLAQCLLIRKGGEHGDSVSVIGMLGVIKVSFHISRATHGDAQAFVTCIA